MSEMLTREQVERLDELFRLLDGTSSPDECYAIIKTAFTEGKEAADATIRQRIVELEDCNYQLSKAHALLEEASINRAQEIVVLEQRCEAAEKLNGDCIEYLCKPCNTVHQPVATGFLQPCPKCQTSMLPSSYNLREIAKLRSQLATAERERDASLVHGLNMEQRALELEQQLAEQEARVKALEAHHD